MTHITQSPMQTVVSAILRQHNLIDTFETSTDFHLRIENGLYMPLVIERHNHEVSIAHYFTQNGDAMRDPEMTFHLPDWLPTSITQDPVGSYACVDDVPYGSRQHTQLLASLTSFAQTWARNIQSQGFTGEGTQVSSLTHQPVLDRPTLSDEAAPDSHMEMQYEDRSANAYEDYEPSPYDGTYSEE